VIETTPCVRELTVDEIEWELRPLPEPPPMTATDQVVEATIDALSYRLLALEAIDQLHTLTSRVDRANEEIRRLHEQPRALAPREPRPAARVRA
jgi:hypothetical protein